MADDDDYIRMMVQRVDEAEGRVDDVKAYLQSILDEPGTVMSYLLDGIQEAIDRLGDKPLHDPADGRGVVPPYVEAAAIDRLSALREAYAACERQAVLASLVAGRPTDFEKGVMSCMAAIQALVDGR